MITGIICEYNPLHLGHKRQLDILKAQGSDVVCLMSGNFVQRGHPAIIDKMARARAAVQNGADLVLEMPVIYALSSAEGFAGGGVNILGRFCNALSFGAETADQDAFTRTAEALLSPAFAQALHPQLDKGLSFPAARQQALAAMGCDESLLSSPNNILGVEYCKAIIKGGFPMKAAPIKRNGSYHDEAPDEKEPSATAVRKLMLEGKDWTCYVPEGLDDPQLHHISNGERAVLARLRTMTDGEFEALPFGSEGLWRKLMREARRQSTLEDIVTAVKSKRYTRTRLDRMVMCAFLGITAEMMNTPAPYVRVLAFNDRGREILKTARETGEFINVGQHIDHPFQSLENRCADLYSLFGQDLSPAGSEAENRVIYLK